MQIVKWDHKEEKGIYKKSARVRSYKQLKPYIDEMLPWFNENNGKFPHPFPTAYAISHCQVAADPLHFFVASTELLISNQDNRSKRDTKKNYYFPSQVIVNAVILEAPEKLKVNKPVRRIEKVNGVMQPRVTIEEAMEKNLIGVKEACMSFPHRSERTVERNYRVKVRYQYPARFLGIWYLKTKTEWVDGLKAHIFQHEVDHAEAENIHYGKK